MRRREELGEKSAPGSNPGFVEVEACALTGLGGLCARRILDLRGDLVVRSGNVNEGPSAAAKAWFQNLH